MTKPFDKVDFHSVNELTGIYGFINTLCGGWPDRDSANYYAKALELYVPRIEYHRVKAEKEISKYSQVLTIEMMTPYFSDLFITLERCINIFDTNEMVAIGYETKMIYTYAKMMLTEFSKFTNYEVGALSSQINNPEELDNLTVAQLALYYFYIQESKEMRHIGSSQKEKLEIGKKHRPGTTGKSFETEFNKLLNTERKGKKPYVAKNIKAVIPHLQEFPTALAQAKQDLEEVAFRNPLT